MSSDDLVAYRHEPQTLPCPLPRHPSLQEAFSSNGPNLIAKFTKELPSGSACSAESPVVLTARH